ncbi:MAG: capsule biosynthesis protein [Pseudomonadota bacterium]
MSEPAKKDDQAEAPSPTDVRAQIEEIKKENLSGQQMRMARRLAQKHGLKAISDLDAVRVLRENGIDPFANLNNPLGGAIDARNEAAAPDQSKQPLNLPAKRKGSQVGQTKPMTDDDRGRELSNIQRDLVRRRRRRVIQLYTRLFFFVILPTILAGYYFNSVATPMYAVKSEFTVQSSAGTAAEASAGSFFGALSEGAKEGISVQSHLTSIEALLALDEEFGYISVFQDEKIDPIQRLDPDATNEDALKLYKKHVLIGFDPTEGVLRMEVIAPSSEHAFNFSNALFAQAERRLDEISRPVREDQLNAARALYNDAEKKLKEARDRVVTLQAERGVISGEFEVQVLMNSITSLEANLLQRRLTLAEVEANARPNPARKTALENQISELESAITEARAKLTKSNDSDGSIAVITGELQQAEAEVFLRQELLSQSILGLEAATISAARQAKFLGVSVRPVPPESPSYPRTFEMTLISFFVFLGVYLMIALTGSILREQMSS